jgi:lipopolysaccharide/colanic/teichoic acid biosynthesis glycosyltransferase
LDELSQLINVLRGDMSLVGPRPEVMEKVECFDAEARKTLEVRPGITDWASIWNSDEGGVLAGAPDPDQAYEKVIFPTKLKLQLVYLQTRSFFGDLKIIIYTGLRVVRKNWTPRELRGYPTFAELRAEVEKLIAQQTAEKQEKP